MSPFGLFSCFQQVGEEVWRFSGIVIMNRFDKKIQKKKYHDIRDFFFNTHRDMKNQYS